MMTFMDFFLSYHFLQSPLHDVDIKGLWIIQMKTLFFLLITFLDIIHI